MEKATFGAGCFWGVEEAFRRIKGVVSTAVGYAGGKTENPTYKEVCTDKTGHAEVIEIEFDPSKITFDDLLAIFFQIHDPTTRNRQGPDVGSQYRSVIFYHSKKQEESARAYVEQLNLSGRYEVPIVTEILPAGPFYRAEEYHQKYHEKNGGSCSF
jgi:peptide-methionine (S)-S-oxide reductase